MKLNEAIEILESHNRWRRGDEDFLYKNPQDPKTIGEAIDIAIKVMKEHSANYNAKVSKGE